MNQAQHCDEPPAAEIAPTANRRGLWLELGVVLLLIGAPTLADLLGCAIWGAAFQNWNQNAFDAKYHTATPYVFGVFRNTFSKLATVAIILLIMARSGQGWSRFGMVKFRIEKDVLIGLGLTLAIGLGKAVIALLFHRKLTGLLPGPVPPERMLLLIAHCSAVGFAEELATRAYLIPRLEDLTGATWKALLLSVAVFAVLHFYQGPRGMLSAAMSGTIWGITFCLTRRVWPVAISHALTDLIVESHFLATLGGG